MGDFIFFNYFLVKKMVQPDAISFNILIRCLINTHSLPSRVFEIVTWMQERFNVVPTAVTLRKYFWNI